VLLREPLLQDKHAEHAEFRQLACQLLQIVHKTPMEAASQDLTLERVWKTSVIKQTKIRFDDAELLKLIQDHLREKGLNQTADHLEKEAGPLTHATMSAPKNLMLVCFITMWLISIFSQRVRAKTMDKQRRVQLIHPPMKRCDLCLLCQVPICKFTRFLLKCIVSGQLRWIFPSQAKRQRV
jgi:hypothetical protein